MSRIRFQVSNMKIESVCQPLKQLYTLLRYSTLANVIYVVEVFKNCMLVTLMDGLVVASSSTIFPRVSLPCCFFFWTGLPCWLDLNFRTGKNFVHVYIFGYVLILSTVVFHPSFPHAYIFSRCLSGVLGWTLKAILLWKYRHFRNDMDKAYKMKSLIDFEWTHCFSFLILEL